MTESDDKLVKAFFLERKQVIEDKDFSKHVLKELPNRERVYINLWIAFCSIVGAILFIVFGGVNMLVDLIYKIPASEVVTSIAQTDPVSLLVVFVVLVVLGMQRIFSME